MPDQELPILLVDDDEPGYVITSELLREINGRPVRLDWAADYQSGREAILRNEHDVYLIDYRLGPDDGVELLREVRGKNCRAPIIILTGLTDNTIDQRALEAGATDYVVKDVGDVSQLGHAIRYALERQSLIRDLEDERSLLHSLMEHLPDHIYFKDRDSRFLRVSRAMAEWFGLHDPATANGLTDADFFTEEHAAQARQDEVELMQSGQAVVGKEEKETWPDGRTTWVSTSKLPLRDESGEIIGTFGISRDITQEMHAVQALRRSERTSRMIVDTALDAFVGMDADGVILNWNPQAEETFGWKADEAIGSTLAEMIVPERYRDIHTAGLQRYLETRQSEVLGQRLELSALHREGHEFPVEITISAIHGENGTLFAAFVHDITRRKESELELRESKEAAEAASQAKSDFLANMSHEIRTPMNAIIGMTELVLDTDLSPSQREYLQLVRDSGDSLLSLINDVLDFSKIEAGRLELESIVFSLRDTLGDTLKSLAVRAHREDLELACHIEANVPDSLIGDPSQLRQIVVNMIGNAIKFTEQGEVVLHVETDHQSDDSIQLHFAVSDTGIGIAPDKLKTIFNAFEQADTSTTRRFGGTGLGLAICARLVRLMHGSTWVESEPGVGSVFHFTARMQISDEAPVPVAPRVVQGTRTLVVDDNSTNRTILEEMLTNWGLSVTSVASADEAEAAIQEADQPFQLILSDVNMPERDGFDLVESLNGNERSSQAVILLLTSGERPDELQRCRELGIAAHLRKPVKQSELFDAIVAALGVESPEPGGTDLSETEPAEPALPPLRVLLVEDSVVNQKLAIALLKRWNHSVQIAANGVQALELFDHDRFDLILMDVQMPEMDGLEATRRIREAESGAEGHVPIIAMTAHALKGDREKCLESGMDSYITKPVRSKLLAREMARLIEAGTTQAAGSGNKQPQAAKGESAMPSEEAVGIHWPSALKTVQGDRDLLRDIAAAFLIESPQVLGDLRQAVADEDARETQRLAHMIKGSFRTFGAQGAHDLAYSCELAAREGDVAAVSEKLPQIQQAVETVGGELSAFLDTGLIPS